MLTFFSVFLCALGCPAPTVNRHGGAKPPGDPELLFRIAQAVCLPVAANGEARTADDYARCRAVSGSTDVMLGRGAA